MTPGSDTVLFRVRADGAKDRLGVAAPVWTETAVPGCSMQPLAMADTVTNTDLSVGTWRNIAPASAPAVGPGDVNVWRGTAYRVQGSKPFYDSRGVLDHTTIILKDEAPGDGA